MLLLYFNYEENKVINYEFTKDNIAKKFTVRFIGFFIVDGAKPF